MGRIRQADNENLYERVLERVALALAQADGRVELDVHGLTPAELALIQAYLSQDAQWLSGWHAAAREHALMNRQSLRASVRPGGPLRRSPRLRGKAAAMQLDCALCGCEVRLPDHAGVASCPSCGSELMRARQRPGGYRRH
ncbi:hypothetical protein [Stutzerimonas tarimensis]|uniref:Zinc ribbon domain-containing protein n=1 Tax=Stutzerimonas tarimensis TaxID=1507735 RepID=A0ABV7T621_9GAMM